MRCTNVARILSRKDRTVITIIVGLMGIALWSLACGILGEIEYQRDMAVIRKLATKAQRGLWRDAYKHAATIYTDAAVVTAPSIQTPITNRLFESCN